MASIEEALEELYATDPSDFTKKRDAIVKELKKAGDKEAAAAIAARRKPTQMAYVLNQLARRHPDAIADLVDVGRELVREQRRALRGEAGHGLRDSIDRQRHAITEAGKRAAAVMRELGVDPIANLQEVTMALQAALVDPAVGAALEEGRLEKAPEAAVGFGGPMAPASEPAEREPEPPRAKKSEPPPRDELADRRKKKETDEAERKRAKDEEAAAERRRAHAAHAKSLAEAKAVLRAAESAAEKARRAAEDAATEAESAKLAVAKAREAAEAAAKESRRLAAEAEDAERTTRAAEKEVTRLEASAPE